MNKTLFVLSAITAGSILGVLKASGRTSSYGLMDDLLTGLGVMLIIYLVGSNSIGRVKKPNKVLDTSLCYLLGKGLGRAFRRSTRRNSIK